MPSFPRLLVPFGALLAVAGCGGPNEGPVARAILVTCDTLRFDRLGVYGYEGGTTPNLDRFAREALVFDRAYASASFTLPALSTVMTGRLPDELGMVSNRVLVPAEATTIAEAVSAAGIRTAAVVSNWVLRLQEDADGGGIEQGFDEYDDRMESTEANRSNVKERTAAETTDAALAWLDGAVASEVERFFLWVHYQDPHGPYTPPEELLWLPEDLGAEPALRLGKSQQGHGELPSYQALGSERRPAVYRARYDAEIRYFDRELGRLFDGLEAHGLLDDALVVFSADHGESLGEHDWWFSHGQTLQDELVHVPLVVRYPAGCVHPEARERDGYRRVDGLAGHVDLPATILHALGLDAPRTHGTSLITASLPEGRLVPQQLRAPNAPNRAFGVTDGRWRLVAQPDALALYDLDADPGETRDLANEHPERVRELVHGYELIERALPPLGAGPATERALSPEEARELEKLGYTE